MRRSVLFALAAAACAPVQPPELGAGGACDAGRASRFVGRPFAEGLSEQARRLSGARAVRTIFPGDVVTMDYRADRLNVHVNDNAVVERIVCG